MAKPARFIVRAPGKPGSRVYLGAEPMALPSKVPKPLRPMLATLIDAPFESKWDGFRLIARIEKRPEMHGDPHQALLVLEEIDIVVAGPDSAELVARAISLRLATPAESQRGESKTS
jgi:hypothetical protein